ncbi:PepSY domain-containing protein [Chitinilyticum piscinae]|uniref:PepSY domain-containing protein n=1 Tax=Chitinilyticum piscinae TaxID=2866724 RepID=A0A8J7G1U9_9NEIS|nr:PepSY domain-containing protein [Chitinilyticum piscinae]MBE9609833.1 PepSY domain-containing protein [Chitinilyticum piscinae]
MKIIKFLLCSLLVLLSAVAMAAVSRDDAASIALNKAGGGRVLSVDKVLEGNKPVWRVKVVTGKGDVRALFVDEATGSVR